MEGKQWATRIAACTSGFGTHFIERLLDSRRGRVRLVFHPEGLECEITLALSGLEPERPLTPPAGSLRVPRVCLPEMIPSSGPRTKGFGSGRGALSRNFRGIYDRPPPRVFQRRRCFVGYLMG